MRPALQTKRLRADDRELARAAFQMMTTVFENPPAYLDDEYLERLLCRENFWVLVALDDDEPVGCITAHTLPMTRSASYELFIYDLAVREDYQRKGIGAQLMKTLIEYARAVGITELFVPADNEDDHALAFYSAIGGVASPVTMFVFSDKAPQ
jgi:aminoglycoside 3-N-acetyltransferase I